MNKAAMGLGVVPEKYQKTRFTASCWFHLAKNAQLSFQEYQRISKDRICRQSLFEQVKQDMELDRLFGKPEAVYPPDPSDEPAPKPQPAPAPQPNTAIATAMIAGLGRSGGQTAKGPLSSMRRAEADRWIRTHLDAGYAQFKDANPEPELDKAWFDKIRKTAFEPAQMERRDMATAKKSKTVPRTGDAQRIRDYLSKVPKSQLEDMTASEYMKASGHKMTTPAAFYAAKRIILTGKTIRGAAPRGKNAIAFTAKAGTVFTTLAELPLDDFKCAPKELREIAMALVKALHPRGAEAKVLILSEPHVMEIRVPFQ